MANKYTALPVPPKEDLEALYNDRFMSLLEVGQHYNTTQKVASGWFKKLNIKRRKAVKRNQTGENNSYWKGNNVGYSTFHLRVQKKRGKANHCEECGRSDNGSKYEWANLTGNYHDVQDYKQMCCSCHRKHDGHVNNFRINGAVPNRNKVKIINENRRKTA